MKKIKLLPFFFVLMLMSCSSQPNALAFQVLPSSTVIPILVSMNIDCTTAYRSNVSSPIETTQSVSLSAENGNAEVKFKDLIFHALYLNGSAYELRDLKLWVTTINSQDEVSSVLYQLSRSQKLTNQIEEHGFTGLNYVYNPVSQSELQFWCIAK